MKKSILFLLIVSSNITLFAQTFVKIQAETTSIPLGSGFNNLTQNGIQYISAIGTVSGTAPATSNRLATYSVTFPADGTYDLYARIRVTETTANTGFTHDAFYYGNGFGTKSATDGAVWITVNNLFTVGTTNSQDIITGAGTAGANVWKWIKLSDFNGGEAPIQFTVSPGALTQTFQIGARENQLDIDQLIFGVAGTTYTVSAFADGSNANLSAPVITSGQTFSASESAPVGTVLATDQDDVASPGSTVFQNWQITGGTGSSLFSINSLTGALAIIDPSSMDFETPASYTLQVTVSDGLYTSLSEQVEINIVVINDPPVITLPTPFSISEQSGNVMIATLSATDPDDAAFQNWQITGGNGSSIFSLDPSTGVLSVSNSSSLDFETTTTYILTITVSDGTNTSSPATITVNVTNENDNVPEISVLQPFIVSGTSIAGTLSATDADDSNQPGYTVFQNWLIVGGTGASIFAINPATGAISVSDSSLHAPGTYSLMITTSDGLHTSQSATITLNVSAVSQTFVVVEAESTSVPLGSGFNNLTQNGVQYISSIGTVSGTSPGASNRLATYSVTFPAEGIYDLYARIRVTETTTNTGITHDAFYYGNGFGTKSATDGNDWITVNNLFNVGTANSQDIVTGGGNTEANVWKWIKLSDFNGGEVPLRFAVYVSNLTQTFQLGARENQLDLDKFVFAASGSNYTGGQFENPQNYDSYYYATDITLLIDSCSADAGYTTIDATADHNSGSCWTNAAPLHNRWFKFTAPATGKISITADIGGSKGTQATTQLALWQSDGMTQVACKAAAFDAEDVVLTSANLTPGSLYYLSVDVASGGLSGTFTLCLSDTPRTPKTFYSVSNGSWTNQATWSLTEGGAPGVYFPDEEDTVIIRGHSITISSSVKCSEVTIFVTNSNTKLTIDGNSAMLNCKNKVTIKNDDHVVASNVLAVQNNGKINVHP